MPTYEYACRKCGHQWEAIQRISEDPLKECPECGQPAAERQISAGTNFILKGGGWYADLYSSGGGKKAEPSPAATPAKTESTAPAAPAAPAPAAPAKPSGGTGGT